MTAALDQLAHEIVEQARRVCEAQAAYWRAPVPPAQKLALLDASKDEEVILRRLIKRYDREKTQPSLF